MTKEDTEFDAALERAIAGIHRSFCDNINTPGVIKEVDEAIKLTNIYFSLKDKKVTLLQKAQRVLSRPFQVMGLQYDTNENSSNEAAVLTALTRFRDEIRENAKSDFKKILEICDRFRDYEAVDLNVRIEDKKIGEPSSWKYENKEILIK